MSYFLEVVCANLAPIIVTLLVGVLTLAIVVIIKWRVRSEFFSNLLSVTAVPFVVIFILAALDGTCIVPNAKTAFKKDHEMLTIKCYMERKAEMDDLINELRPMEPHPGGYYLLDGVHGCGKTTIIQRSLSPYSKSGIAHLYIEVTTEKNLADTLYQELKLDVYCHGWWSQITSIVNMQTHVCVNDPTARIKFALRVLTQAAQQTKEEDGVPPVVVFDNLALIMSMPGGLRTIHQLQDYAKERSDKQTMVILFASSESIVPNIMRSRSAKSRLSGGVHVGDITDKEAVNYLTCMCPNISSDVIHKAVDLVGGRFAHLKTASKYLRKQSGLAVLRETLFGEAETTFSKLPLEVKTVFIAVVQYLLQSPTKMIDTVDYDILVRELTIDQQQLIEMTNFIEIKRTKNEVYFASRFVRQFFEEKLNRLIRAIVHPLKDRDLE